MLDRRDVIRLGALLGISGGVLRAIGSFAPLLIVSGSTLAGLYVLIDVCLAAGLSSTYILLRGRIAAAGAVGFYVALFGLIAMRITAALAHFDLYPIFAAMIALGILVLAFSAWRAARLAAWVPATFALSLVSGSVGTFVAGASSLFVASGIFFGVAFAALGNYSLENTLRGARFAENKPQ
jgi:hypothetical protein